MLPKIKSCSCSSSLFLDSIISLFSLFLRFSLSLSFSFFFSLLYLSMLLYIFVRVYRSALSLTLSLSLSVCVYVLLCGISRFTLRLRAALIYVRRFFLCVIYFSLRYYLCEASKIKKNNAQQKRDTYNQNKTKMISTMIGFEPTRTKCKRLAISRLNHSATLSNNWLLFGW